MKSGTLISIRRSGVVKTFSAALSAIFIVSNLSYASVDTKKMADNTAKPVEAVTADAIGVAKEIGTVKTKYTGSSDKVIIHIQDAHCNYEAQTNISKILENFSTGYAINLVSVEGADGYVDTGWFKAFPDAEIRKEVADYFMKKGEITGAEFLSITKDYPIKLYGAENKDLYIKNLTAFTSTYPIKGEIEKYLTNIKTVLAKLKGYIYNDQLKNFDAKIEEYKEKKITLSDYAKLLSLQLKRNKLDLAKYTDFSKLVYTLVYEDKINFETVNQERTVLIDRLSKALPKEKLEDLVGKSVEFKTGKITASIYYQYLKDVAIENKIDFNTEYQNLANYVIYTRLYEKIDNEKLFKELDEIKNAIKDKMFQSDDQRKLSAAWDNINILIGLINIKLSNDEYTYYKAHRSEFEQGYFLDFIKSKVGSYNLSVSLDEPTQLIKDSLPKMEQFYEVAVKRDGALVENTLKSMALEKTNVAVLITGGFHTEGIEKILKNKGISYVVVCPNITKDEESPYIQVLTNQRTPFEDLLVESATPTKKDSLLAPISRSMLMHMSSAEVAELNKLIEGIAGVVVNDKTAWISGYLAGWITKYAPKIEEQGITLEKEAIKNSFVATVQESGKNLPQIEAIIAIINSQFDAVWASDEVSAIAKNIIKPSSPGTPGTGATGIVLTEDQAGIYDIVIRALRGKGDFEEVDFSNIRKGMKGNFYEGYFDNLIARGLPADRCYNVHPGRGGEAAGHALLQFHFDKAALSVLSRAELETIARHELAHLDAFNIQEMVDQGMSKEAIKTALVERYGSQEAAEAALKTWDAWLKWIKANNTWYKKFLRFLGMLKKVTYLDTLQWQEDFVNSLPGCDTREIAKKTSTVIKSTPLSVKLSNLSEMRRIVNESKGVSVVGAITNAGDGNIVEAQINNVKTEIFKKNGKVAILSHEEKTRRGQWLGLLDAIKNWLMGNFYNNTQENNVRLGIMMPGQGTRFSPFTQTMNGIKPSFPMLIRASKESAWLSGAEASLYAWNLVAFHLNRMGFKGIAWKWGDEPQIPSNRLSDLKMDLTNTDIVRFGSMALITDDLAENKEWLNSDKEGNLTGWARRRPREQLLAKFGLTGVENPKAMVHIGSPAFSDRFIRVAMEVFGTHNVPENVWLDVDGYLIEALTMSPTEWTNEKARDKGIAMVLAQCPNFYELCQEVKQRINAEKGLTADSPLNMKVVDFGENLYWGDIGQLGKGRESIYQVALNTPEGIFARELACINDVKQDKWGNRLVGDSIIPDDGSVRNSVIIDTKIYGKANINSAVIVNSNLGNAVVGEGSVVFGSAILNLHMGKKAFSFRSVIEELNMGDESVHTSMPTDMNDISKGMDSWIVPDLRIKNRFAIEMPGHEGTKAWFEDEKKKNPDFKPEVWLDSQIDVGGKAFYLNPCFNNPRSFKEQQDIMRQRNVIPQAIEHEINDNFVNPMVQKMKNLAAYLKRTKPLGFGTSGLRDLVTNMTDQECYINARGFIEELVNIRDIERGESIAIAGDRRGSTGRLLRAMAKAIEDSGCKVVYCGRIPSPAVAYFAQKNHMACIMVTGSHIPDDRNGIKFNRKSGEVLKSDEQGILRSVAQVRFEEGVKSEAESLFNNEGMWKNKEARKLKGKIVDANREAKELYIKRYIDAFGPKALEGLRIGLYQHSAVGRDIDLKILQGLGAEVVTFGRAERGIFVSVDTEKVSDKTKAIINTAIQEQRQEGTPLDLVMSIDGDSDRPLLADENGNILNGDKLGLLACLTLNPTDVIFPDTCVNTSEEFLTQYVGVQSEKIVRCDVGSPYVVKGIHNAVMEDVENARPVGYEANGGFLLGFDWKNPVTGGELDHLITRDAMLPIILAATLKKTKTAANVGLQPGQNVTISAIINHYLKGEILADVVDDKYENLTPRYETSMGKEIVKHFSPADSSIKKIRFDGDKIFVTNGKIVKTEITGQTKIDVCNKIGLNPNEPMIQEELVLTERELDVKGADADLAKQLRQMKAELEGYFQVSQQFPTADIKELGYMAGVRVIFAENEEVRLRPSGNAPEFRFMCQGETLARVSAMVKERFNVVGAIVKTLFGGETADTVKRRTPGIYATNVQPAPNDRDIITRFIRGSLVYLIGSLTEKPWGTKIGDKTIGEEEHSGRAAKIGLSGTDEDVNLYEAIEVDLPNSTNAAAILGQAVVNAYGTKPILLKGLTPGNEPELSDLSVQLHDTKNELWVVTKVQDENSSIILGFNKDMLKSLGEEEVVKQHQAALAAFQKALENANGVIPAKMLEEHQTTLRFFEFGKDKRNSNTPEAAVVNNNMSTLNALESAYNHLNSFYNYEKVKVGDVILVAAGTLHALLHGVEVIEPQIEGRTLSISDGTKYPVRYKIEVDENGALKTIRGDDVNVIYGALNAGYVYEAPKFTNIYTANGISRDVLGVFKGLTVERATMEGGKTYSDSSKDGYHILQVAVGEAVVTIGKETFNIGVKTKPVLIPASAGAYTVTSKEPTVIIKSFAQIPNTSMEVTVNNEIKQLAKDESIGVNTRQASVTERGTVRDKITLAKKEPFNLDFIPANLPVTMVSVNETAVVSDENGTVVLEKGVPLTMTLKGAATIQSNSGAIVEIDYAHTDLDKAMYTTINALKRNIANGNIPSGMKVDIIADDRMYKTKAVAKEEEKILSRRLGIDVSIRLYTGSTGLGSISGYKIRDGAISVVVASNENLRNADKANDGLMRILNSSRTLALDKEALQNEKYAETVQFFGREIEAGAILLAATKSEDLGKADSTMVQDLLNMMMIFTGKSDLTLEDLKYLMPFNEVKDSLIPEERNIAAFYSKIIKNLLITLPITKYDVRDEMHKIREVLWSA